MAESGKSSVVWHGDELLALLREHLDDALFEGAKVIQEAAQSRAPVGKTKKLRASIYAASFTKNNYKKTGKTDRRIKPKKGTAVIAAGAFYAGWVEYGTRKMHARPFLRPALDENKNEAMKKVADYLKTKLDSK